MPFCRTDKTEKMKNTWERLKCVLSSCSSQTELLWFKQRDGTGLIRLQREREWARFDVWGYERGSQQAWDELSADSQESAGGWMLNQLSSSDHRDTGSDTNSQRPIKTCRVFTNNITIVLQLNAGLRKNQKMKTTAMIDHEKCDLISPLSVIDFMR